MKVIGVGQRGDQFMRYGNYSCFENMSWPLPQRDSGDVPSVEWKLRYNPKSLTKEESLYAASVLDAYRKMIFDPTKKRQMVVKNLRHDFTVINK